MSNVISGHVLDIRKCSFSSVRTVGGPVRPEAIEEMDHELTKVIEDFDRAVNVEALRQAKETGKHALSQFGESAFSVVSCRTTIFAGASRTCQDWGRL